VVAVTSRSVLMMDEIRIGGQLRRIVNVEQLHNGARLILHTREMLIISTSNEYLVHRPGGLGRGVLGACPGGPAGGPHRDAPPAVRQRPSSVVTVTSRSVLVMDEIRMGGEARRVMRVEQLHTGDGARLSLHTGERLIITLDTEYLVHRPDRAGRWGVR
jgi:sugar diacid utilization regulator